MLVNLEPPYVRRKRERAKEKADAERVRTEQHDNRNRGAFEQKRMRLEVASLFLILMTVVITGLTYVVFYCQLRVSEDAAKDSHIAYTAVQRAFVTMGDLRIDKRQGVAPGKVGSKGIPATFWWFTPIAQNSGNTPTRFARAFALATLAPSFALGPGQGIVGYNSPVQPVNPDTFRHTRPIKLIIGPHASSPIGGIGIPIEALEALHSAQIENSNQAKWFIYGQIYYYDLFPGTPEHVTRYCYDIFTKAADDGGLSPSYGLCPHWNCADDECIEDRKEYDDEVRKEFLKLHKPIPPEIL